MGRWEPTPNPSQEGNVGRWEPTPNPSQEGNVGRWGDGRFLLSDAARSWGGSAAKGGSPHEQLPWFPP